MDCPRCHAENRPDRRFCGECGLPFTSRCLACGFSNEAAERFCGGCGTPLALPAPGEARFGPPESYTPKHLAERILRTREALEGERKQVTVLFADIKGSMEMLVGRDPEEAQRVLDPVVERMMSAVHRYEGTVNQVMGDGIMALFGAPVAHEDHALRAGYAALRMQAAIGRFAEEARPGHGVEVAIRVGLNSGEVMVRGDRERPPDGLHRHRTDDSSGGPDGADGASGHHPSSPGVRAPGRRHLHVKPWDWSGERSGGPVEVFELVGAEPTRARFAGAGED